ESSPAIMLDEAELEPIDEDIPVELADEFPEPAAPEPVAAAPAPAPAYEPEPVHLARAQSEPIITSAARPGRDTQGPRADRDTQGPRGGRDTQGPKFIDSSTNSGVRGPGTGPHAAVDLGLDAVAQDADREQSGVYDRKSLRKIGELERQIAQLKSEL